jgi:4-aminobutyrate aminotransferase-like enzyme
VQLSTLKGAEPPLFSAPAQVFAWSAICPSPAALLGPASRRQSRCQRRRFSEARNAHFAGTAEALLCHPPQIERGWKEHMFDVEGRAYLDMVNNVTILGHGHPRLAEAVSEQWLRLNTNSRFHYIAVADFSERLAALAPDGLDTVFLVNSGSEANDLALRLAWAHTGARNMLCLLEAYHGWSVASDAVSTSIADNPQALTTRPDWVHPVAVAQHLSWRIPRPGFDRRLSRRAYFAALERSTKAARAGRLHCRAGLRQCRRHPLPDGYLASVYGRSARAAVSASPTRCRSATAASAITSGASSSSVVPDIITIAKGMGNGHPLGAVITTRAIADSLEKEGYFFSSPAAARSVASSA